MPPSPSLRNPRRTPRVPIRLRVDVVHGDASWSAETADLGPGGCLMVSPRPLVARAALRLTLRSAAVSDVLTVAGSVAWSAGARGGVAFGPRQPGAALAPDAWFRKLLQAMPALAAEAPRVPERIPLDAAVFLRRVPAAPPPLSADELALVRALENGVRVEALLARAGLRGDRASRALFGLLQKRVVTFEFGESAEEWPWRALLSRAGAPRRPAPHASAALPAIVRRPPAPEPAPVRPAAPPVLPRATPLPRATTAPDAPAGRPARAQVLLDEARAAATAGRIHDQALPLLRRALAISPRDPEIAQLLGELAFKDRKLQ